MVLNELGAAVYEHTVDVGDMELGKGGLFECGSLGLELRLQCSSKMTVACEIQMLMELGG